MQNTKSDEQILADNQKNKQRLERMAWLMDSVIPLPGGFRIGIDSLIGLIPVIGDSFSALLSTYIIGMGVRQGVPAPLIFKMVANILFDTIVGMVPVLGDLFDIANRANHKNVNLLKDYFDQPNEVKRASLFWLVGVIFALILIMVFFIWLSVSIIEGLLGLI